MLRILVLFSIVLFSSTHAFSQNNGDEENNASGHIDVASKSGGTEIDPSDGFVDNCIYSKNGYFALEMDVYCSNPEAIGCEKPYLLTEYSGEILHTIELSDWNGPMSITQLEEHEDGSTHLVTKTVYKCTRTVFISSEILDCNKFNNNWEDFVFTFKIVDENNNDFPVSNDPDECTMFNSNDFENNYVNISIRLCCGTTSQGLGGSNDGNIWSNDDNNFDYIQNTIDIKGSIFSDEKKISKKIYSSKRNSGKSENYVFPNPTKVGFATRIKFDNNEFNEIKIFDRNYRLIKAINLESNDSYIKFEQPGFYYLILIGPSLNEAIKILVER